MQKYERKILCIHFFIELELCEAILNEKEDIVLPFKIKRSPLSILS